MDEARVSELVPLDSPPENRPRAQPRPCAACGEPIDPLRARSVMAFEDGFRFLCDASCAQRFRKGQRPSTRPSPPPPAPAPSAPAPAPAPVALDDARERPPAVASPWLGMGLVVAAALVGLFARSAWWAGLSAAFTCMAAANALWISWRAARDIGWLAWALGPAGAVGAALAAAHAVAEGSGSWLGLQGAALAAAAVVARAGFDAETRRPVAEAVARLLADLPPTARVPRNVSANESSTVEFDQVPVEQVRTGEDVVVLKGDVVPVDGVVQAGDARALLHPGTHSPLRRGPGDPLMAGARIVEGAVRLLTTRVGDQRALVRMTRLQPGHDAPAMARWGATIARWGAPATLLLAALILVLAGQGGLSAPLSTASAVLLAAPLLALRRATESPMLAAAAAAGVRGIVYHGAEALDRAGRVSVVAISPYGILTEGRPEVEAVSPVDDVDVQWLIGVAAAAEDAAEDHPVAGAIRRFAHSKGVGTQAVRRATFLRGRGVTAIGPDGQQVVIGNRRLLLDEGISVAAADAAASRAEARGRRTIFVAIGDRVRAVMSLRDEIRPGARAAIQRMFDMGLEVFLLTGDQLGTVTKLARGLDIAHVKAELLPHERAREVERLRDAGGKVAAIGHAEEDAVALSAADVGIALSAAGGASGERAIALTSDDIRDAAAALWIARAAREGSLKATRVAAGGFAIIVVAAAAGLVIPAIAAVCAFAIDAYAVRAGGRLLRRIALRLPAGN